MPGIAQEKLFPNTIDWEKEGLNATNFYKEQRAESKVLEFYAIASVALRGTPVGKEGRDPGEVSMV